MSLATDSAAAEVPVKYITKIPTQYTHPVTILVYFTECHRKKRDHGRVTAGTASSQAS